MAKAKKELFPARVYVVSVPSEHGDYLNVSNNLEELAEVGVVTRVAIYERVGEREVTLVVDERRPGEFNK